ncbi:cupin domain-containing protein [Candidatus Dojkabacteria bacterium]|jgi:mannose-6-phosphate isomerase-like protein (cupin superfamily)|nr:cupin domain-containing protein [Candidatus Dojkabacteria bacterium]
MVGFIDNIEKLTQENTNFRKVIFTGRYAQLVLMSLLPKEEIGMEVHPTVDQFFRIESGDGEVVMNGEKATFTDGFAFIVPAGTNHNIINTSDSKVLKLYTIYSPANHKDGTIHATKADAIAAEASK